MVSFAVLHNPAFVSTMWSGVFPGGETAHEATQFIARLSDAAAAWPISTRTQQPTIPTIGFPTARRPPLTGTSLLHSSAE
jgi:hypothetical protein